MRPTLRDIELLDTVEALPTRPFNGDVYRLVRDGRDPTACWHSKGRWDDGEFDVLYTALSEAGALAEVRYHILSQQPFAPDRLTYRLFRIPITGLAIVDLSSWDQLSKLGVDRAVWGRSSYVSRGNEYLRTQEIAAACEFHEKGGILVPSARSETSNIVVLTQEAVDRHCGEPEDLGLRKL